MRVLYSDLEGKVVLNPPNLPAFVSNSKNRAAAIVLIGSDIIVSTAYTDHCSMMDMAGIEHRLYALDEGGDHFNGDTMSNDPSTATLRGGLHDGKICFDIWHRSETDDITANTERLDAVYSYIVSHRKLRGISDFELAIYNSDYVLTHTFGKEGLVPEARTEPHPTTFAPL